MEKTMHGLLVVGRFVFWGVILEGDGESRVTLWVPESGSSNGEGYCDPASPERCRLECAGGEVQVVEGFVGNDEEFEVDGLRDWEPVEVT